MCVCVCVRFVRAKGCEGAPRRRQQPWGVCAWRLRPRRPRRGSAFSDATCGYVWWMGNGRCVREQRARARVRKCYRGARRQQPPGSTWGRGRPAGGRNDRVGEQSGGVGCHGEDAGFRMDSGGHERKTWCWVYELLSDPSSIGHYDGTLAWWRNGSACDSRQSTYACADITRLGVRIPPGSSIL